MIRIMGRDLCVLTSPADATQYFKDETAFPFDGLAIDLFTFIARLSKAGIELFWRPPPQPLHPNPKELPLIHLSTQIIHKWLLQPGYREETAERTLKLLEEATRWDTPLKSSILASDNDERIVSLFQWTLEIFTTVSARAFYGDLLLDIEPAMADLFKDWDENSWMTTYQYPAFMAKAATVPRNQLMKALRSYIDSPADLKKDALPLVRELEQEHERAGISSDDSARHAFIFVWA